MHGRELKDMERFLPWNYEELLKEKYGPKQQNTTIIVKDVVEEVVKEVVIQVVEPKIETEVGDKTNNIEAVDEVIFEVDIKNNNIDIGDQAIEDRNICLLEMVDTNICVEEEGLAINTGVSNEIPSHGLSDNQFEAYIQTMDSQHNCIFDRAKIQKAKASCWNDNREELYFSFGSLFH
ncbi:hypothetical protein RHSIM_Rhsim11G0090800 [Rhododendron simsii]|uniref:Uncharacterized protein n=1 Tax=Rhododendron simsii TaxID=118357 RepID=A0A834G974_RHOSS|nr:hypothetical protein RHSIM_Rhsim11G0090800 [Rhododendron simsii]